MTPEELAAIRAEHHPDRAVRGTEDVWCSACGSLDVPCLPYRLAAELTGERAKGERVLQVMEMSVHPGTFPIVVPFVALAAALDGAA